MGEIRHYHNKYTKFAKGVHIKEYQTHAHLMVTGFKPVQTQILLSVEKVTKVKGLNKGYRTARL